MRFTVHCREWGRCVHVHGECAWRVHGGCLGISRTKGESKKLTTAAGTSPQPLSTIALLSIVVIPQPGWTPGTNVCRPCSPLSPPLLQRLSCCSAGPAAAWHAASGHCRHLGSQLRFELGQRPADCAAAPAPGMVAPAGAPPAAAGAANAYCVPAGCIPPDSPSAAPLAGCLFFKLALRWKATAKMGGRLVAQRLSSHCGNMLLNTAPACHTADAPSSLGPYESLHKCRRRPEDFT